MKKVIVIIITIFLISLGIFYSNSIKSENEVKIKESLIEKQERLESDFKSNGYTLDNPNIILDPYDISPLTALVIFETNEEVEPTIIVNGKDENTTITNKFNKNKIHYLPVYGLYPDCDNKVTIKYNDKVKELNIKTDKLPKNFALPTKVTANKDKLGNELYFYTPSAKGYVSAYDCNGDVRWYLNERMTWNLNRLKNGNLSISTERLVNPPYYTTGFYEINFLGKVFNEYSLKGGYHHDYFELENGNFIVASNDFNNKKGTVEDYIVEIDKKGKVVKTIDLKDILNMDDGKSESWTNYDWFHNNSVWYDKKTNSLTLSGRHKDAVVNIDYDTLKINYIIGDKTNWNSEYHKYFLTPINDLEWQWSQHAAMITPEGYVFIFDNGNNKSKEKDKYVDASNSYSRGVMYEVNTKDMTIKQIWQYGKERGSNYYSPYISDVDYLNKNHYIVHSGGISYKKGVIQNQPAGLVKADKLKSITTELLNDEIIFELELPTNNYRCEKMSLYGDKFEIGKPNELGSLGKTPYKKGLSIILNSKKMDDEYKKHNISIIKEKDRLAVKGTFKQGTKAEIILVNGLTTHRYEYRISTKPYTAMCVDIFDNDGNLIDITATKYINDVKLKGKYNIFIKIDDKIYKTNEYVKF